MTPDLGDRASRSRAAIAVAPPSAGVADKLAASRKFMNRHETPASTPENRTALAGEIAMAKSGLPPASAASRSSAAAGKLASHRIASAAAISSRALSNGHFLCDTDARKAPCRRARRSRRHRGRSAPCSSRSPGRGMQRTGPDLSPGEYTAALSSLKSAPRARHQRAVDAALRTALRGAFQSAPADILAHPAGIGRAGRVRAANEPPTVSIGSPTASSFGRFICVISLSNHRSTMSGHASRQCGPANRRRPPCQRACAAAANTDFRIESESRSPKRK